MTSDLIGRGALLDSLEEAYKELKKICDSLRYEDEKRICNAQLSTFAELTMRVRKAPTVDAEPVRHGKWRHLGGDEWCCTVCGEVIYTEGSWEKPTRKYCHECGAKMDKGVQNDQN